MRYAVRWNIVNYYELGHIRLIAGLLLSPPPPPRCMAARTASDGVGVFMVISVQIRS